MEAAEAGKVYFASQLPLITAKAAEIADAKIKAEREKQYAVFDAQLLKLKVTKKDADGADVLDDEGKPVQAAKTWKDFDIADPKGELDVTELANMTSWIGKEVASRVATGKMSKDEAGSIAKTSGGAALMLALLMGASKLAKKVGGKKDVPPKATV